MKIGSFEIAGGATYGAVTEAGIVDIGKRLGSRWADLAALLASEQGMAEAAACARSERADASLDEVTYLPVIPHAAKIFCIGVNYADHLEETKIRKSEHPTVFLRYWESQVGHRQAMIKPRESTQFDFEGEVAVIIGRAGRRIAAADAWQHVAGYSCYNDGSARDWQFHTTQWGPGKNFAGTGAFGPWMTTSDELDASRAPLTLKPRLNGELVQQATTDLMIFGIPEIIAYCSALLPLRPGDVLVTGTPGGVGMARNPQLFMQEGDTVEVEVGGVGTLVNTVAIG